MTIADPVARFTPDDLLRIDGEGLYELVDGQLIEKHMSYLAGKTTFTLGTKLYTYTQMHDLGDLLSETTFQCFPEKPGSVRRPDIAFIAKDRAPADPGEGHIHVAPDLIVEIISPSDRIYELDEKLADYRSAAVKLVWVVNPNSRTIRVHRLDGSVSELSGNDAVLNGESVLPGFSAPLRELFPPAVTPKQTV
jgi:Uma2 family endonuclease